MGGHPDPWWRHGVGERAYGEAEVLFSAKNTSFEGLQRAGVIVGGKGKVRLRRRDELDPDWNPATDRRITDWEGAQHLTRSLTTERGGGVGEAARLTREATAPRPIGSGEVRGEGIPVELDSVAGAVGSDGAAVAKAERLGEEPFQSESVELQP